MKQPVFERQEISDDGGFVDLLENIIRWFKEMGIEDKDIGEVNVQEEVFEDSIYWTASITYVVDYD